MENVDQRSDCEFCDVGMLYDGGALSLYHTFNNSRERSPLITLWKNEKNLDKQHFLLFIHQWKTGRIMLSPVGGGRAASPILCPEHISKTMLATVMKLHGWIDLIKAECSAQEP